MPDHTQELRERVQKKISAELESFIATIEPLRFLYEEYERPHQVGDKWHMGIFDPSQRYTRLPDGSMKPIYSATDKLETFEDWKLKWRRIIMNYTDALGRPIEYMSLRSIVKAELTDVAHDLNEHTPIALHLDVKENKWISDYVAPPVETYPPPPPDEPLPPVDSVTEYYRGYSEGVKDEAGAFYVAVLQVSIEKFDNDDLLFAVMDVREALRSGDSE